ncbi:LysE family translocator [Actinoallomurus liliacearum]
MPDMTTYEVFIATAVGFLLVPGPAILYTIARSVDQGRAAGLASAAGLSTGDVIQVAAATFGLSAIVAASATAFTTVRYLGAAYLIYLGVRRVLSRDAAAERPDGRARLSRIYGQGVLVNALNPKNALFFLAFLPQFVSADAPAWPQVLLLGMTFVVCGAGVRVIYSLASNAVARRLPRGRAGGRASRYVSGGLYIALGVAAATTGSARR